MTRPADAKFRESHEWARVDGDLVLIGISDFAVEQLNDLTYCELPEVGDTITKGETFGEIESVKAVSDLYAPVSGEVVAVNNEVDADDFAAMKANAFEGGWLLKVKASDLSEMDELKDLAAYEAQLAEES